MAVTPLPDALTTLDAVKAFTGVTSKDADDLTQTLIHTASAWIRNYIDHDVFPVRPYQDEWSGAGDGSLIWLNEWPVVTVDSVVLDSTGQVIPKRVGAGSGYRLEGQNLLRLKGYRVGKGEIAVVNYTAGFDARPADLQQACIDIVTYELKRRTQIRQNSKTLPSEVITYDTEWASKLGLSVLEHWKRVAPRGAGLG